MATRVLALATTAVVSLGTTSATICDVFDKDPDATCVAAHSTTRALYAAYDGPLYQVRRASDMHVQDIGLTSTGGVADSAAQDTFCAGADCTIFRIYDQSPFGNNLNLAPPGGAYPKPDVGVNASKAKITLGGHPVYGAYFEGTGQGYRIDVTNGVAQGNDPESMVAVLDGTHFNGGCCFDYGNAESNNLDTGAGSMEAIYFGNSGGWGHGGGKGPWIMADLENGLWAGNVHDYEQNPTITYDYVTAMVKGRSDGFALKGGDAQQGDIKTLYDGPRPSGYQPMKKQGSIILGIGGDNSDRSQGTFFEGAMTTGISSNATDAAVQANIVAAGYGK